LKKKDQSIFNQLESRSDSNSLKKNFIFLHNNNNNSN